MKFFDTRTMGQNERFQRVALIMIPASVIIGLFFAAVNDWLFMELSVLYVLVGALIGYLILKIGRGAQERFRYLAVVCAVVMIVSADVLYPILFYGWGIVESFRMAIVGLLEGPSGMISILFRGLSLIAAHRYAV